MATSENWGVLAIERNLERPHRHFRLEAPKLVSKKKRGQHRFYSSPGALLPLNAVWTPIVFGHVASTPWVRCLLFATCCLYFRYDARCFPRRATPSAMARLADSLVFQRRRTLVLCSFRLAIGEVAIKTPYTSAVRS